MTRFLQTTVCFADDTTTDPDTAVQHRACVARGEDWEGFPIAYMKTPEATALFEARPDVAAVTETEAGLTVSYAGAEHVVTIPFAAPGVAPFKRMLDLTGFNLAIQRVEYDVAESTFTVYHDPIPT